MIYFKYAIIFFSLFFVCSCTNNPSGIYEGEIGRNFVSLDFTIDSTVIVKDVSLADITRAKIVGFGPEYYKEKAAWEDRQGVITILDGDSEILYALKRSGNDLIDTKTGERLTKAP